MDRPKLTRAIPQRKHNAMTKNPAVRFLTACRPHVLVPRWRRKRAPQPHCPDRPDVSRKRDAGPRRSGKRRRRPARDQPHVEKRRARASAISISRLNGHSPTFDFRSRLQAHYGDADIPVGYRVRRRLSRSQDPARCPQLRDVDGQLGHRTEPQKVGGAAPRSHQQQPPGPVGLLRQNPRSATASTKHGAAGAAGFRMMKRAPAAGHEPNQDMSEIAFAERSSPPCNRAHAYWTSCIPSRISTLRTRPGPRDEARGGQPARVEAAPGPIDVARAQSEERCGGDLVVAHGRGEPLNGVQAPDRQRHGRSALDRRSIR